MAVESTFVYGYVPTSLLMLSDGETLPVKHFDVVVALVEMQ